MRLIKLRHAGCLNCNRARRLPERSATRIGLSRVRGWWLCVCVFLFVGFDLARGAAATGPDRPNILFCISDDQSFPHTSAYGCPWVQTPAFDRIAAEGLLFQRAYAVNAKCSPSRACILTGRNSWQLGAAANHAPFYPAGFRTFMEALSGQGYFTGYCGKGWSPGDPGKIDGKPRLLTGRMYDERKAPPPTRYIAAVDYAANFQDFLQVRPAGQPFCFWYGGHEPHRRYEFGSGVRLGHKSLAQIDRIPRYWPDDEVVRNDLLDYAFEIEYFDKHLAGMLAALDAAGQLENTIIIVTSDNGMPFPRGKGASYELSHHMPLAIRWARGIVHPGRSVDAFVSLIDVAPTLLDVVGLDAARAGMEPVQGRTMLPLLRDEVGAAVGRDHVLVGQERGDVGRPDDVGYPVRGIFEGDFLYLRNFEPARWPMSDPVTGYLNADGGATKTLLLEQNRHGVNHWMWDLAFGRRPPEELYDLRRDPDCMVNLSTEPSLQTQRLALNTQLLSELRAQGDPRLEGLGDQFEREPYSIPTMRDFYRRYQQAPDETKSNARAVEPSDFEVPGFNAETPLAPSAPVRSPDPKPGP